MLNFSLHNGSAMRNLFFMGIIFGITNAGFIYFNWTSCKREAGSSDRNCIGTRTRIVRFVNDTTGRIVNNTVETESCNLTTSVIDGGYTTWTAWADCSGNCNGKTYRSRTCHNPTPCNGGNDCQILGADTLEKQCGPVDGQWGSWESWETCINPNPDPWDIHGIGIHIRRRYCNDNAPICGGADCIGPDTDSENCTVITNLRILHHRWGFCEPEDGAKDQTCAGTRTRLVQLFNTRTREVLNKTTETEACFITLSVTDGGYTMWSAWADCSGDCYAMTHKTRICNNPTPCNGGKDCHDLGADRLEKQCGPVDGQWGSWGSWGSCSYPGSASIYGTGTHIRRRYCNETAPMCGGDDCIGPSTDSGNCRVVPPCLTPKILDERYLRKDSPMVIYTSARVEIYPLTRNNCTQSNILFNFWNLFLIDSTNGNETQIGNMTYTLNFRIDSEAGLYRLYIKIGYPQNMLYWMEESMYIQIVHPPPHASIRGGDGRTIGKGLIDFDSSSVSYNLINGPGDPSGLTFQWKCLNFVTNSLYTLIKLNIDQLNAFNDQITEEETKWYQTGFTTFVEEQVPWINASVLYQRIKYYGNTYTNCSDAGAFYVKIVFDNSTDSNVTTEQYFELVQLTQIFNIKYMNDMKKNPNSTKDKTDVFPLPSYDTLVKNELLTFLDVLFDASELHSYTTNFYSMLSSSYLTLQSIMQLQNLDGLPPSADTNFFKDLTIWLKTAKRGIDISYQIQEVLDTFDNYLKYVNHGLNLTDFIGIDGFIQMSIDSSRNCWLDFLTEITEGFTEINSYDWFDMKEKERFYTDWIENELFKSSSCPGFVGSVNGTGSLNVSEVDVDAGMGYVLIVRVDFEGSVSYFTQFAQSVNGTPPLIEVECRFNCMKKTALTSIMSLKSSCPFCTVDQLRGAIFWWNVKDFDTLTRSADDNNNWQNWMLSERNRRQFVMKADVLTANTGYLIEAYLQLSTGTVSMAIWSVTTNILPYGGSCEIENANWGEFKITVSNWKDEGFRSLTNPSLDWKEQIHYRIVQIIEGKEVILYYGFEEENYVTLKPGLEVDNYTIAVRVQIFDIFVDFAECTVDPGKVFPKYTTMDSSSISAYLTTAGENIDYYYNSGNVKQVAMNTEVAATSVTDLKLPITIFDTDPSDWINLGVETSSNGTTENLTFEDLWNSYENPDLGDVLANNEIMSKLSSFVDTLNSSANAFYGTSTVNINQMANSFGTNINNKQFVSNTSAATAFSGNQDLLDKLILLANNETYPKYEDYLLVCEAVLRVLNNALESMLPVSSADTPDKIDLQSIMDVLSDREKVNPQLDSDLTSMEKAYIVSKIATRNDAEFQRRQEMMQKEVTSLLDAISSLGTILEMLNYRKQLPVYVQHGHMNSTQDKKYVNDLVTSGFYSDDVRVTFIESNTPSAKEQNVKVTIYDHTPFSWDTDSKYISSKTVSVTIEDEDGNNNSVIPSEIKIKNSDLKTPIKSVQIAINNNEATSQLIVYKLYWNNPEDSLIFFIENVVSDLNHILYISQQNNPSEGNYDWKKTLNSGDLTSDKLQVIIDEKLYLQPTLIYVGVLVQSEGNGTISRKRRSVNVSTSIVEYSIVGITVGCRVWDDSKQTWDKSSCTISSASTINDTVCLCTNPPGNSFATTFYVPPNTIDFGSVFANFNLNDNAAVFVTVICLLAVYMLLSVWAYRQDKKDPSRWAISYLSDNAPYDEYLYIVTAYTGLRRHAGTTSKIRFMLVDGDALKSKKVKTNIRCLDDFNHKGFSTGSVRRFVMSMSKRINDPAVLKIWHDNSGIGKHASWYLNKITLEDIQTKEKFNFVCNNWLSLDHEDGNIECAIPVSDKSDTETFSFNFNEKSRENVTDSYLWLSVLLRPESGVFTRIQRLACCLTLLFLTMITNAMFYGQDNGSKLSIGPLSFSTTGFYISFISVLIAAPPIFLITYLFRNSRQGLKNTIKRNKEEYKTTSDLRFPFTGVLIAWILIFIAVFLSGFFLILYSMEWGKSKSEEWLLCFFLSFFQSIFLIDPLKIIIMSIILSWIVQPRDRNANYNIDMLRSETKKHAISAVMNWDYNDVIEPAVNPLRPEHVQKLRKKRQLLMQSKNTITELILYVLFLAILYVISFSNRDPFWYYSKEHIDQQIITETNVTKTDGPIKFSQVSTGEQLYAFISSTLLPFMFPKLSINNVGLNAYARLFTQDQIHFKVGPVRLRQLRVKEDSCPESVLLNVTTQCYDKYSLVAEDEDSYCVGWKGPPCAADESVYKISSASWKHVSSSDIWGLPITGKHAVYGGGGFIADLNVNLQISNQMIEEILKYSWIDRQTRAIFIEFTLFNADENVFIHITLLNEFPETGGVLTSHVIKQFRPYQHVGSVGILTFICEIIAVIGISIFCVKKIIYLHRTGKKSLQDIWNILDIVIISLFILCTIAYIGRLVNISLSMDKFQRNKLKFVNFSHIVLWDDLFNIFLACDIFFITLRLMRILNFNNRINHMGYIFSHVSKDVSGCLCIFVVVHLAFVCFGYLIFGRHLETYKNMFVAATTLTNAIIGKNTINDLFVIEPILGRLYYFMFVVFLLWVIMTMLNATLNVGISKAKTNFIKKSSVLNAKHMWSLVAEAIEVFIPFDLQRKKRANLNPYKVTKDASFIAEEIIQENREPVIYFDNY